MAGLVGSGLGSRLVCVVFAIDDPEPEPTTPVQEVHPSDRMSELSPAVSATRLSESAQPLEALPNLPNLVDTHTTHFASWQAVTEPYRPS